MTTADTVTNVAAAVVPVAATIIVALDPPAAAIVALVAAAVKETPALVQAIESVIADFKASSAPQGTAIVVPLDFKDESTALDAQLHGSK